MLSIEDIYNEIGKNIFISPINVDNFRDNSVDLTASEFAWTTDKDYIYDENSRCISVPSHKTACILTRESIYVSSKIGGTYHSRVSLVKKGFSHIGTMLDPEYCGQSLIVLHNTTDHDLSIEYGERLVSVVFYYLNTPIHDAVLATPPSHSNKVAELDVEERYKRWCDNNPWANNAKLLKAHFIEKDKDDFEKKKRIYSQKKGPLTRIWTSDIGRMVIKYFVVGIIYTLAVFIINTKFSPIDKSNWAAIAAAIVVGITSLIYTDLSRK